MKRYIAFLLICLLLSIGLTDIGSAQSGRIRPKPAPNSNNSSTNSENNSSEGSNTPKEAQPKVVKADPSDFSEDDATLKIDATLVTIPTIVSDRNGRYVPFLKPDDFKVFEDGILQEVSLLSSEKVPFKVALVMDTSGSISDSLEGIQQSAINFVRELRENDEVMVIDFNSRVELRNDFTSDREKIRYSIKTTRAGGGTRLYDALYLAGTKLKGQEGRKAIILLTDGEDTESRDASERDAIDAVLESGALNYVIQFPASDGYMGTRPTFGGPPTFPGGGGGSRRSGPGRYPDTTFLLDLVRETGGDKYYAGGRNGLPDIWHRIAEELRYVYVVGYYPSNPIENGGYRKVNIQLKDQNHGAVRYKKGYKANKTNG
ncbi:MAG: VWA domain-containing protein [Acidobacteria bacterium]|nr:VWA domain-containing protein [Acidobacteriota bacterium]